MSEIFTSCKENDGITVGLVDGIIATCRILSKRYLNTYEVSEALKDLRQDSDVELIFGNVVITTNENGECVLVSRQDEDHNILKVIWEKK